MSDYSSDAVFFGTDKHNFYLTERIKKRKYMKEKFDAKKVLKPYISKGKKKTQI